MISIDICSICGMPIRQRVDNSRSDQFPPLPIWVVGRDHAACVDQLKSNKENKEYEKY